MPNSHLLANRGAVRWAGCERAGWHSYCDLGIVFTDQNWGRNHRSLDLIIAQRYLLAAPRGASWEPRTDSPRVSA